VDGGDPAGVRFRFRRAGGLDAVAHPAAVATLALYGLLALAFAVWVFSLATQALGEGRRWALRFAGVVFGLVGAAELLGAMAGGHDPLQPLAGVVGARVERQALPFRTIKSLADLDREVAAAKAAGKPLLFDFYADWCVACKEMEKYTFPAPEVHAALEGFVLLKADVTANDATDQALMQRLGIIGPPATLFYVDGAERRELRLFGFEDAEAFVRRAERAR
jgi:thiol:disulfide interchange protein DsbD